MDGDELYDVEPPPAFLEQVPPHYHCVCKDSIEYRLTWEDLEEGDLLGHFPEDMPRLRYHLPLTSVEARFVRHRPRLQWSPAGPFPAYMGLVYPGKIRCRHFPHRSPVQIQKRLEHRLLARRRSGVAWAHEQAQTWQQALLHRSDLVLDPGDGSYHLQGAMNEHRDGALKYLLKRLLHGLGILP